MSEFILINVGGDEFSVVSAAAPPPGATIIIDVEANRPAAGVTGRLFWATDTKHLYIDTGTTWDLASTLLHSELTGLGSDDHLQYLARSGARAMLGALTLAGDPSGALHAATKQYVDNLVLGQRIWQWGVGFISGTVSTGSIFANVPVASIFNGAKLQGWVYTARSVGTSATNTTLNLLRNGLQISSVTINSSSPTLKETLLNPEITLTTGDVLSAAISSAPASGQPSGLGVWVFGKV